MALTVETGEGLTNADSLVTLMEVRAFASARGLTVPSDDNDLEVLVRNAHDYLLYKERKFKGRRRNPLQSLPWPRSRVFIDNVLLSESVIPDCVKHAVCQLISDSQEFDLFPIADSNAVIEEKVGPITTKYSAAASANPLPEMTRALALLLPVLLAGGRTRTRRI